MRFFGTLAIFLATSAQATVTEDGLCSQLSAFKDKASGLQGAAKKLTADDCSAYASGKGSLKVCVDGIQQSTQQATGFVGKLSGSPNYCGGAQGGEKVLAAYTGFVDEHCQLFDTLSVKAAVDLRARSDQVAGEAMVSALCDIKAKNSVMATFVAEHLPCKKDGVGRSKDKIGKSLDTCIGNWKKVCGKKCDKYN